MSKKIRSTSSARLKRAPLSVAALLTKFKLQFGLMSAEKAVEWAEARSSVLEDPPYFLHEMTSMANASASELAAVLDDAMAGSDEVPALRILLGGLHGPLSRNPRVLAKLADVLALICDSYGPELPEDMQGMDSYSDRLEREGAASSEAIRQEMLAFLDRYRGLT